MNRISRQDDIIPVAADADHPDHLVNSEFLNKVTGDEYLCRLDEMYRWLDEEAALRRNADFHSPISPPGADWGSIDWPVEGVDEARWARTCVIELCEAAGAEGGALLLVKPDAERILVVTAAWSELGVDNDQRVTIRYSVEYNTVSEQYPRAPLYEFFGEPCRDGGGDLPGATSELQIELSPETHPILDLAILGSKGSLRGLFRLWKGCGPKKGKFTGKQRARARALADKYALLVERQFLTETLCGLMQAVQAESDGAGSVSGKSGVEVLQAVARRCQALVAAVRVDIVLWNDEKQDLVVQVQAGRHTDGYADKPVPSPSIIREVWTEGGRRYLRSVAEVNQYHCADPKVQSELAVRVDWNGKALGVLNVESDREDGFDDREVNWLKLCGVCVANTVLQYARELDDAGVLTELINQDNPPSSDVLAYVLKCAQAYTGCDAGLVYCADYSRRRLCCTESLGCEQLSGEPGEFSFPFDGHSLACHVFQTKQPYYSPDVQTDPTLSPEGVERFRVAGPAVGVPIVYAQRVVGVLILWSRRGRPPSPNLKDRLSAFAQLAAPSIAAKGDECLRQASIEAAELMLSIRQNSRSDDELLRNAVTLVGKHCPFERVRLFKFNPSERQFVPYDCYGMADKDAFLSGGSIEVAENAYALDTVNTAISNPNARVYHPGQFGPDPASAMYGKHPEADWMVVPLVVRNRLYGQIVVDNGVTGRKFDRKEEESLNFLAKILAESLAHLESIESIRQGAFPVLVKHLSSDDSYNAHIRRLLTYLTCGEALGFTRALYLELQDKSRRLVFRDAVGPTTHENFSAITSGIRRHKLGLDQIMRQATRDYGPQIRDAMSDFELRFEPDEIPGPCDAASVAQPKSTIDLKVDGVEGWKQQLAVTLASRISGTHFLVTPVIVENHLHGMFVVDLSFQERKFNETDYVQLEAFAELAGYLLSERNARRRAFMSLRDDATIGKLAQKLPPEMTPARLNSAQLKLKKLRRKLSASQAKALDDVRRQIKAIKRYAGELRLWQPKSERPRRISPDKIVERVLERFVEEAGDVKVFVSTERPTSGDGRVRVHPDLLYRAIWALVSNAKEALAGIEKDGKRIEIILRHTEESLVIEVCDNGPGLPPEFYEAEANMKDAFTSSPEKGLGLGFTQVRHVVNVHCGVFHLQPGCDNRGLRAIIRLPREAQLEDRQSLRPPVRQELAAWVPNDTT